MSNIYEADISNLFAELMAYGSARRRAADIARWFGNDRQVPTFWEKLYERFHATLTIKEREENWRLFATQNEGQMTLCCWDPVKKTGREQWWTEVSTLTAAPSPGPRKKSS